MTGDRLDIPGDRPLLQWRSLTQVSPFGDNLTCDRMSPRRAGQHLDSFGRNANLLRETARFAITRRN